MTGHSLDRCTVGVRQTTATPGPAVGPAPDSTREGVEPWGAAERRPSRQGRPRAEVQQPRDRPRRACRRELAEQSLRAGPADGGRRRRRGRVRGPSRTSRTTPLTPRCRAPDRCRGPTPRAGRRRRTGSAGARSPAARTASAPGASAGARPPVPAVVGAPRRAPSRHARRGQPGDARPAASGATTATMPTPMLSVRSSSSARHAAEAADQRRRPAPASRWRGRATRVEPGGQDPGEVGRQPAAGDVAKRVHVRPRVRGERQAVAGRRSGWARAAPRRACGRAPSTCAVQRPAGRAEAARAGPASSRWSAGRDEAMAITTSPARTRSGPSRSSASTTPGAGAGDVVLVGAEQPRVLGGLAADQRAAGRRAALGDAA